VSCRSDSFRLYREVVHNTVDHSVAAVFCRSEVLCDTADGNQNLGIQNFGCSSILRTALHADAVYVLLLQFEAVYNTAGYIQATQNDAYFNVWADSAPPDTLQTFQKPPGDFSLIEFISSSLFCSFLGYLCRVYGLVYDVPNGKRQTFLKPPGEFDAALLFPALSFATFFSMTCRRPRCRPAKKCRQVTPFIWPFLCPAFFSSLWCPQRHAAGLTKAAR